MIERADRGAALARDGGDADRARAVAQRERADGVEDRVGVVLARWGHDLVRSLYMERLPYIDEYATPCRGSSRADVGRGHPGPARPSSRAPRRSRGCSARQPAGRSGDWNGDLARRDAAGLRGRRSGAPERLELRGRHRFAPLLARLPDRRRARPGADLRGVPGPQGPRLPRAGDRHRRHRVVTRASCAASPRPIELTERPLWKLLRAPVASADAPSPPPAREPRPARAPFRRPGLHVLRIRHAQRRAGSASTSAGQLLFTLSSAKSAVSTLGGVSTPAISTGPRPRRRSSPGPGDGSHVVHRRPRKGRPQGPGRAGGVQPASTARRPIWWPRGTARCGSPSRQRQDRLRHRRGRLLAEGHAGLTIAGGDRPRRGRRALVRGYGGEQDRAARPGACTAVATPHAMSTTCSPPPWRRPTSRPPRRGTDLYIAGVMANAGPSSRSPRPRPGDAAEPAQHVHRQPTAARSSTPTPPASGGPTRRTSASAG